MKLVCPPHQRPEVDIVLISRSYRWMLLEEGRDPRRSNRNRLTLEAMVRVMVIHRSTRCRRRTEQGNEKSLQPNTHSYNQNHTITVFVKYTRNALQITRLSQTNKSNALTCIESTNQHSPGDSINKPNRTGTTPVKYNAKDWACGGGEASKLNPNITSPRRLVFSSTHQVHEPRHYFLRISR